MTLRLMLDSSCYHRIHSIINETYLLLLSWLCNIPEMSLPLTSTCLILNSIYILTPAALYQYSSAPITPLSRVYLLSAAFKPYQVLDVWLPSLVLKLTVERFCWVCGTSSASSAIMLRYSVDPFRLPSIFHLRRYGKKIHSTCGFNHNPLGWILKRSNHPLGRTLVQPPPIGSMNLCPCYTRYIGTSITECTAV